MLDCKNHKYETISEYVSEGKNISGKKVKARMRKVKCSVCNEENIQFVEKL